MDYLGNTDFKKILELLAVPRRILIASHTNPDGDAIGAALALYGYLLKKGHSLTVMIPDPDPAFLHWMPFHENLMVFDGEDPRCLDAIGSAELFFALDFNNLSRLSAAEEYVRRSGAIKILVDHHTMPSGDFRLKISYADISSTSEIIYDFIEASGDLELIDTPIAECIYAGIVTDTGSFSYSCNYARTYRIIAVLYERGIDGAHIHNLIYDTFSEQRLRLLGYSISQKLVVMDEYHAAYISLTLEELERYHHQVGDTEDIVNFALSVDGVNLAALFYEREDGIIKVSLRSKGNFAVNVIAKEYFQGGGHINAAGANCTGTLQETIRIFTGLLPRYKKQLQAVYSS